MPKSREVFRREMDERLSRSRPSEGVVGEAVRDIATTDHGYDLVNGYNPVGGPDAIRRYGDIMYWKHKLQQPPSARTMRIQRDLRTD